MAKKKNQKRRVVAPAKQVPKSSTQRFPRFKVKLAKLGPTLGIVLLCSCAVFFASWIALFDLLRIDSWVESKFVKYADAFTNEEINSNVVLIAAVEDPQGNGMLGRPNPSWRRYHAALIDALIQNKNKPKVIAFDLFFEEPFDGDGDFGAAINRATNSGTTVVLGVKTLTTHEGVTTPIMAPLLKKTLEERNWGFLEVGGADKGTVAVRKLRLAQEVNADLPTWAETRWPKLVPSFTIQVLRGALSQQVGIAFYDKEEDQLKLHGGDGHVVKSIPVDEALNYIVNERETAALEKITRPYSEVYDNRENSDYLQFFNDKIVIIGYKVKEDSRAVATGDSRYGVEIQASALSDLLQSVQISKPKPVSSFLAIGLMSLIGFIIGTRYRHVMRPTIPVQIGMVTFSFSLPFLLVAITAAYLFLSVVVFKYNRILLPIPYHVAVLFLTFVLADQIESRKTRPSK